MSEKMYKITMYCIDFDNIGIESIKTIIDNNKYIHLFRFISKEANIGEWDDENPLNFTDTPIEEFEKYFKEEKENE